MSTNANGNQSSARIMQASDSPSRRNSAWVRGLGVCACTCAAFLLTASCSQNSPLGRAEFAGNPPDLRRIPIERVRSSMWVLAGEVAQLDELLRDPYEGGEGRRLEVESTLARMKAAARTIDEPGRSSQHPLINRFLGLFIERLERAERGIRRDPPNYYMAGTVAGACLVCHSGTQAASSPIR